MTEYKEESRFQDYNLFEIASYQSEFSITKKLRPTLSFPTLLINFQLREMILTDECDQLPAPLVPTWLHFCPL